VNEPKVSVITVVRNGRQDLEETIQSVIGQDYPDIEYLVIDGGSTDGTLDLIRSHEKSIDYWVSEPDRGVYDAMNKGLVRATGEFVTFLNAGDCYAAPTTLSELFSGCGDADIVYGDILLLDPYLDQPLLVKAYPFSRDMLFRYDTGTVNHQAMFVRRDIAPPYNISYRFKGDLDWYFLLLERLEGNGRIIHRPMPVVRYRMGGLSCTSLWGPLRESAGIMLEHGGVSVVLKNIPLYLNMIVGYGCRKNPVLARCHYRLVGLLSRLIKRERRES